MPNRIEKRFLSPRHLLDNTGIYRLQAIDDAAWVWHPSLGRDAPAFVVFRIAFDAAAAPLILHVSADERYELFLDGVRISRGPDRSDVEHWSYASYRIELAPGQHELKALAWVLLPSAAPMAQLSHRGGFVLKAEGVYDALLTTGVAPWAVARAGGWMPIPDATPHVYGVGACLEWAGGMDPAEPEVPAATIRPSLRDSEWGCASPGWKLFPSTIPDRLDRIVTPGRAVAAGAGNPDAEFAFPSDSATSPRLQAWNAALQQRGPIVVPPDSQEYVLADLGDYFTGYPVLDVSGGRGSSVRWSWAESLFVSASQPYRKGNRGEVIGKHFLGMTDSFPVDGVPRSMTLPWWRAGRFWLIRVQTAAEPLEIRGLALNEERYPLEMEGSFAADDPDLDAIQRICVRGMQCCAHETYMDCPYYEQLMYVGDTRLEMLTHYVMSRDARLAQRCIDLFDYSRVNWGFVNERYPSSTPQHSPTFSLIWTLMLHDFMLWRGAEPEWFLARMTGLRAMLEQFKPYEDADGLLSRLPGWPFMDWVGGWKTGNPPGAVGGVSGLVNLLYVMALQHASALETIANEPLLARRHRQNARRTAQSVRARFWNADRKMLADDPEQTAYSEHTQALALLSGAVQGPQAGQTLRNLLRATDLKRASSYFSFYVFEALRGRGRADLVQPRLEMWREMVRLDCRTPLEAPEPSRSDCHAWSSQPLYHLFASIAGIRPSSVGFKTVSIAPQPGAWKRIAASLPHPSGGTVDLEMNLDGGDYAARIALPPGVTGSLRWGRTETALREGTHSLRLPVHGFA